MSRMRLLDTDQLMTEEVWENDSDKEEVVEEDQGDDFLFGEETGHDEDAALGDLRRASI